jgi:hypothetical protein
MTKPWETYEEGATYLLNQFAQEFGLDRVEGKQNIVGRESGTTWEIDAKGVRQGNIGFVIVECRRYTTSKQNQDKIGSLAYKIIDTGAGSGIIVSLLGLQEGAERIAAARNIISVRLNEDCHRHEYVLGFLNKMMIGVHDTISVSLSEKVQVEVVRERYGYTWIQHPDGLYYGPLWPNENAHLMLLESQGRLGHASLQRGE